MFFQVHQVISIAPGPAHGLAPERRCPPPNNRRASFAPLRDRISAICCPLVPMTCVARAAMCEAPQAPPPRREQSVDAGRPLQFYMRQAEIPPDEGQSGVNSAELNLIR